MRHHVDCQLNVDALLPPIGPNNFPKGNVDTIERLNLRKSIVVSLNTRLVGGLGFSVLFAWNGIIVKDLIVLPTCHSRDIGLVLVLVIE